MSLTRHLIVLLAAVLLTACAGPPVARPADGDRPVQAVASYSIIADLVQNVGGERVAVTSLVAFGQDPHTYEPTPRDMQLVAHADIIFYNGFDLELWFDRLVQNAGGQGRTVEVSAGITPRVIDTGTYRGYPDPHAWMDVRHVMHYVGNIQAALTALDLDGQDIYAANAAAYLQELAELDAWIRQEVSRIPAERRLLVTTEDAFRYFAAAYGFEVVGYVFALAPEDEPSARHIAALIDRIDERRVPAVFIETTLDPKLMQRIVEQTGAVAGGEVYVDSLGEPGSAADSYVAMMQHNVRTIVAALAGP